MSDRAYNHEARAEGKSIPLFKLEEDTLTSQCETKSESSGVANTTSEIVALLSSFPLLFAALLKIAGIKTPDWLKAVLVRKDQHRNKEMSKLVESQDIIEGCDKKTEYSNIKISRLIEQLPEQLIETSKTSLVRILAGGLAIIGFVLGVSSTGYVTADFVKNNGDSGDLGTSIGIAFIAACFGMIAKGAIVGPFRAQKETCEKIFAVAAIVGFSCFAWEVTGHYFIKQPIQIEGAQADLSLDFSDANEGETSSKQEVISLRLMYIGALLSEAYYSFLMATMFLWANRPHVKEIVDTIDDNLYKERQKEAANAKLRRKHKAKAAPRELAQKEVQAPAKFLERVIRKLLK